ncbi:MAG TPA: DNA methyltransferase [Ktedonobacterales bacterium]|nr:DNA methyltransferase [Ktedonobacterales bacterium]
MADMGDRANTLYFGDNLDILRHKIPSASVDLIYLDPPFNSNADYNVIFKEQTGQLSSAQIQAFTDTWHWTPDAERAREEVLTGAAPNVAAMLDAMVAFIGRNDLTAYLVMMTQRLIELHRVLKPTGSLYLHCDPTASHYLKIVLDTIFGPTNFRNEISWKRTSAHSDTVQGIVLHMGRIHDVIFFYTKTNQATRNESYQPYSQEYTNNFYRHVDEDGRRYRLGDITGPGGAAKGNPQYEFLGVTRYWRYSKERMQALYEQGRIVQTAPGRVPAYKRYLDEMPGVPLQDYWDDIQPIGAQAQERLGYPTQKPLALLERIITASSNPGDVVMDCFCGCGTAICAAQKLGRRWIGIDITHLAVSLMKSRLKTMFDLEPNKDYQVEGEPKDVSGARELALNDRYQFQYWAVSLIEAVAQEQQERKKGRDRGIDGIISFIDGPNRRRETVIVQVKSGHVTASHIRDLKGVIEREKAAIGLYICLETPTRDMRDEANTAGFYHSDLWPGPNGDHRWPRIQLRTVEDLLSGRGFAIPPRPVQFKAAERVSAQPAATMPGLWTNATTASAPDIFDTFDIAPLDSQDDDEDMEDVEDDEDVGEDAGD